MATATTYAKWAVGHTAPPYTFTEILLNNVRSIQSIKLDIAMTVMARSLAPCGVFALQTLVGSPGRHFFCLELQAVWRQPSISEVCAGSLPARSSQEFWVWGPLVAP
jgi:hypothetical protein